MFTLRTWHLTSDYTYIDQTEQIASVYKFCKCICNMLCHNEWNPQLPQTALHESLNMQWHFCLGLLLFMLPGMFSPFLSWFFFFLELFQIQKKTTIIICCVLLGIVVASIIGGVLSWMTHIQHDVFRADNKEDVCLFLCEAGLNYMACTRHQLLSTHQTWAKVM